MKGVRWNIACFNIMACKGTKVIQAFSRKCALFFNKYLRSRSFPLRRACWRSLGTKTGSSAVKPSVKIRIWAKV